MQSGRIPGDGERRVRQRESPLVGGVDDAGVVDRLEQQPRQVDRLALQRSAGIEARQQQQVLHQRRHPRGLGLDLGQGGAGGLGPPAGQLGVAGDGRQRRTQLVRGVGDELPHLLLAAVALGEGGLDVVEHRVERRADLADLGALVGECRRHPLGHLDLPGRQRQLGDAVRRGRDLAQGRQLAAYDDHRGDRGERDADEGGEQLEAQQVGDGVLDLVERQPGDDLPALEVGDRHAVVAEAGQPHGAQVAVGLVQPRQRGELRVGEGGGGIPASPLPLRDHHALRGAVVGEGGRQQVELADLPEVVVAGPVGRLGAGGAQALQRARQRGAHVLVEAAVEVLAHGDRGGGADREGRDGDEQHHHGGEPGGEGQGAAREPELLHGAGLRT